MGHRPTSREANQASTSCMLDKTWTPGIPRWPGSSHGCAGQWRGPSGRKMREEREGGREGEGLGRKERGTAGERNRGAERETESQREE